jgi:5'-nucleotidase
MEESEFKNRRKFLQQLGLAGVGIMAVGGRGVFAQKASDLVVDMLDKNELIKLTILHTNDLHSRIEAFPSSHKTYANQGGLLQIGKMVKKIRAQEKNVLVLDSGDIFQGTPYFNVFGGEVEFKLMSEIGYDCATMGNHDFDNGLEGFDNMLPFANFPFVTTNYDFTNTILKGKTKSHHIIQKGDIKIGIFSTGIMLEGLVNKSMFGETVYKDPIEVSNATAAFLKQDEKCDVVICLSHLGYEYQSKKVSDLVLAAETKNIDLILGGHTHTFLEQATVVKNKNGEQVLINQAGWSGLLLGRVDLHLSKKNKKVIDLQSSNFKVLNAF